MLERKVLRHVQLPLKQGGRENDRVNTVVPAIVARLSEQASV